MTKDLNLGGLVQEPTLLTTVHARVTTKPVCVRFLRIALKIWKQTVRTVLMTFSFHCGRLCPEEHEKKLKFVWRIEGTTDNSKWHAQELCDSLIFLYGERT